MFPRVTTHVAVFAWVTKNCSRTHRANSRDEIVDERFLASGTFPYSLDRWNDRRAVTSSRASRLVIRVHCKRVSFVAVVLSLPLAPLICFRLLRWCHPTDHLRSPTPPMVPRIRRRRKRSGGSPASPKSTPPCSPPLFPIYIIHAFPI